MEQTIDMQNSIYDSVVMELWEQFGVKSLPERFLLVLTTYSVSKLLADAITEWSMYYVSDSQQVSSFCICSHTISSEYFVRNEHNGNILRIGSECINKFMNDETKQEADVLRRQLNYKKAGNDIHRMCANCHRHSIPKEEPIWKTVCKSCFKKGERSTDPLILADGRECSSCHKMLISKQEPDWKTTCHPCYKNLQSMPIQSKPTYVSNIKHELDLNDHSKITDSNRQCSSCYMMNIAKEEPSWKTVCKSCYISKQSTNSYSHSDQQLNKSGYRECVNCYKKVISNDEPAWKTRCSGCYARASSTRY